MAYPGGRRGLAGAAGATGATGATGAAGPAGPAPAGTGLVSVTDGVLDTPTVTALDLASAAAGLSFSMLLAGCVNHIALTSLADTSVFTGGLTRAVGTLTGVDDQDFGDPIGTRYAVSFSVDDQEYGGIYTVTDAGGVSTPPVLTRAVEFDSSADFAALADAGWACGEDGWAKLDTSGGTTLDTSAVVFITAPGTVAVTTTSIGAVPASRTVAGAALSDDVSAATIAAAMRTTTTYDFASAGAWVTNNGSVTNCVAAVTSGVARLTCPIGGAPAWNAAGGSTAPRVTLDMSALLTNLRSFRVRARLSVLTADATGRAMIALMNAAGTFGYGLGVTPSGVAFTFVYGNGLTTPNPWVSPSSALPVAGTGWVEIARQDGVISVSYGTGVGTAQPAESAWVAAPPMLFPSGNSVASAAGEGQLTTLVLTMIQGSAAGSAATIDWDDVQLVAYP